MIYKEKYLLNCKMLDLKPTIQRLRIESKYGKAHYKQDF